MMMMSLLGVKKNKMKLKLMRKRKMLHKNLITIMMILNLELRKRLR